MTHEDDDLDGTYGFGKGTKGLGKGSAADENLYQSRLLLLWPATDTNGREKPTQKC